MFRTNLFVDECEEKKLMDVAICKKTTQAQPRAPQNPVLALVIVLTTLSLRQKI